MNPDGLVREPRSKLPRDGEKLSGALVFLKVNVMGDVLEMEPEGRSFIKAGHTPAWGLVILRRDNRWSHFGHNHFPLFSRKKTVGH